MNDVYENNMRFLPLLKFIEKYKKILTFIAITIILAITFLIISGCFCMVLRRGTQKEI